MSKILIVTVGTSIIEKYIEDNNNLLDVLNLGIVSEETLSRQTDIDSIKSELDSNINSTDDRIYKKSAELKIIRELINGEKLKIYLLYSETIGGEIAIKHLGEILKNNPIYIEYCEFEFIKVDGWQVKDKELFQGEGIKNLYENLTNIENDNKQTEILVSPLGGYKSIIPYVSLFAMVHKWPIYYVFEDENELVDIPNGLLSYLMLKKSNKDEKYDIPLDLLKGNEFDAEKILNLINAVERFESKGDLGGFEGLNVGKEYEDIILNLVELDNEFKFGNVRSNHIKELLNKIRNVLGNGILDPIFNQIVNELKKFKIEGDDLDFYFSLLEFYHAKKLYLQGFLFMREFFIDCISYLGWGKVIVEDEKIEYNNENFPKRVFLERKVICNYLSNNSNKNYLIKENGNDYNFNIKRKYKINYIPKDSNDNFFKEIGNIRNYFAHYKEGDDMKDLKEKFKKYYELLSDFYLQIKSTN